MPIRLLVVALVALAPFGAALANEVQFHVCAAGQNLGEAYARTQYFNGLLGPDQSADVALNLANAAAHIEVAEAGVQQPFSTNPERKRSISELQGRIAAYARNSEGRSPEARMSMIQGFYTHYLNALAITYVSSRPVTTSRSPGWWRRTTPTRGRCARSERERPMRVTSIAAILLLSFASAGRDGSAAPGPPDTRGEVTAVEGTVLVLAVRSGPAPFVGDTVSVMRPLEAGGNATPVGTWRVTEVQGTTVRAVRERNLGGEPVVG